MRLIQFFGIVMILGASSIASYGQTPVDPSSISDPGVAFNDPYCPTGSYCADITFTGAGLDLAKYELPNGTLDVGFGLNPAPALIFSTPSPDPALPPLYTCSSDVFLVNLPTGSLFPPEFTGCFFNLGILTVGDSYTISALGGPVELTLPTDFSCQSSCSGNVINLSPSPEPATAFLYLTGLVCLILSVRKRFGVHSST